MFVGGGRNPLSRYGQGVDRVPRSPKIRKVVTSRHEATNPPTNHNALPGQLAPRSESPEDCVCWVARFGARVCGSLCSRRRNGWRKKPGKITRPYLLRHVVQRIFDCEATSGVESEYCSPQLSAL
jgi:hypothetical protein